MSRGILSIRQAEMRERLKRRIPGPRAAMSPRQIAIARDMRRLHWTYQMIADRFSLHRDTVRKYVTRAD